MARHIETLRPGIIEGDEAFGDNVIRSGELGVSWLGC
jgi:hypothetical protein